MLELIKINVLIVEDLKYFTPVICSIAKLVVGYWNELDHRAIIIQQNLNKSAYHWNEAAPYNKLEDKYISKQAQNIYNKERYTWYRIKKAYFVRLMPDNFTYIDKRRILPTKIKL